ncbi:MAG: asparaginase [Bdellovibrionales bacterium]
MKSRQPISVEVTRGSIVESLHHVVAVVVDRRGTVVDHFGNLDYVCLPRSSIKLLQTLPLIESGAAVAYQLHDKHLVLSCASHRAEPYHLQAGREWLERLQQTESILRCGPCPPTNTPLSHNCSGKHLGMVTTAQHLKLDPKNYDKYEHPIQEMQRRLMSELFGADFSKLPYGGDGCGIPTYGVPVQKIAFAMSHFLRDGLPELRKRSLLRILDAIRKYPEFLSGEKEGACRLVQATQGRAILKPGAEATYTGLMPEKGYAFALKVIDGNCRAADFVSFQLFRRYGAISDKEAEMLKDDLDPAVLDSRGLRVGNLRLATGA